jgi:hypothetical protein
VSLSELLDAIDAELADLMASRRNNPAAAIGHAFRILELSRRARLEHDRELWAAQRELEIALWAGDVPANVDPAS